MRSDQLIINEQIKDAVNAVLDKIRDEIETEITPNLSDEQTQAFIYVLQIIDKIQGDKE